MTAGLMGHSKMVLVDHPRGWKEPCVLWTAVVGLKVSILVTCIFQCYLYSTDCLDSNFKLFHVHFYSVHSLFTVQYHMWKCTQPPVHNRCIRNNLNLASDNRLTQTHLCVLYSVQLLIHTEIIMTNLLLSSACQFNCIYEY